MQHILSISFNLSLLSIKKYTSVAYSYSVVYDKYPKFQEKFEDEDNFFDALRAAGGSNSDKLIKLAEEIGKDELIGIVLDYDHSLKWAINEILN